MDEPTRPTVCAVCGEAFATRWSPRVVYAHGIRIVQERVLDGFCDRCSVVDTSAGRIRIRVVD